MDIKNNIFSKVTLFENKVAEWFNAPYGVAVDCCTHGLELCLRYNKATSFSTPVRTYLSVPLLSKKLNIEHQWRNYKWKNFYHITPNIIDAAVLWEKNSYLYDTFMVLSFQFKKHLNLGRGGMILTDNEQAAIQLRKMAHDGRILDKPWAEQDIDTIGYHYYMTPETAELGLSKFDNAINTESKKWSYNDYPDISKLKVFLNG